MMVKANPKALTVLLVLMFMLPVANKAFGWTEGDYSEGWVSYTDSAWESGSDGESQYFDYAEDNYANFQLWSAEISLLDMQFVWPSIWTISTISQFYTLTLTDDAATHEVKIFVEHWNKLFLFGIVSQKTDFQIYFDGTPQFIENPYAMINTPVKINVFRNETDTVTVSMLMDIRLNTPWLWSRTFNVSASWFATVDFNQRVNKELAWRAVGFIKGVKLNEHFQQGVGPISNPNEGFTFPSFSEGYWNTILQLFDTLQDLATGTTQKNYYVVTVLSGTNGTTIPSPADYSVEEQTYFSIKAIPNNSSIFDVWLINETYTLTDNPLSILINGDTTIRPIFAAAPPPPSLLNLVLGLIAPITIIGGLGAAISAAGEKVGGHGTAGMVTGAAMGLILCAQASLVPVWMVTVIFLCGTVGLYFWFKGGG